MSESDIRVDLFAALQELSEVIPEMRSGQLMAAVGELCADLHGRGLWDAADGELLEAVWLFRRNYEAALPRARTMPNHKGLESAKPDLQSLFKKPGGATAQRRTWVTLPHSFAR